MGITTGEIVEYSKAKAKHSNYVESYNDADGSHCDDAYNRGDLSTDGYFVCLE